MSISQDLETFVKRFVAGKSSVTSSSWSEDDSDSNDAAMTSYRDVTTGRRGPEVRQLSASSADQLTTSSVIADSPTDLVETFDVYYVLPPTAAGKRTAHRGKLAPPSSCWTGRRPFSRHGELMTLTERRRPNANCLLDAVPPTPSCCDDLRAATLPASLVNHWTSLPHTGFVSICHNFSKKNRRRGKEMIIDRERLLGTAEAAYMGPSLIRSRHGVK